MGDVLKAMDITDKDMECVFAIIDEDHSGTVEYEEFAEQLWKMKSQEQQTTLMILKYYILQTWQKITNETSKLQDAFIFQSKHHQEVVISMCDQMKQRIDASQEMLDSMASL